eukprot:11186680-Lingulodinium_polyedra.AAC.1
MSRALPAAQTWYAIGNSRMGRRCMGSAWSPPGFGSSRPSGCTSGQPPARSTASSTAQSSSSSSSGSRDSSPA